MTALQEIRDALNNQGLTLAQIIAGLTRAQKATVLVAMINSRLPITIASAWGDVTIVSVGIIHGDFYVNGYGVIQDDEFDGDMWRVGFHPPPLFVPDAASNDLVRGGDHYRLDPPAAIRAVLVDIAKAQR